MDCQHPPEKVDKLVFIYTNARSLRNDTTVQVDDDELIGMEDDIMQGVVLGTAPQ